MGAMNCPEQHINIDTPNHPEREKVPSLIADAASAYLY